jgi:hypothetical protein
MGQVDNAEWDAAWRERTDHRLPQGCKLDLAGMLNRTGTLTSVTVSAVPLEFAERVWCPSDDCPVCGPSTTAQARVKTLLDVQWADGIGCFVGAWSHADCLSRCPALGPARHVPW